MWSEAAKATSGPCPCGDEKSYVACCRRFHAGDSAPTAEALMRSRYAAYAVGDTDHVFRTWHPRTRPASVSGWAGTSWTGLRILRTEAGGVDDDAGMVEFEATYLDSSGRHVLREASRFERRRGRWVYLGADADADAEGSR